MANFQGFESFEVYANADTLFIKQVSLELGKAVTFAIPVRLWEQFVEAADIEIAVASEQ